MQARDPGTQRLVDVAAREGILGHPPAAVDALVERLDDVEHRALARCFEQARAEPVLEPEPCALDTGDGVLVARSVGREIAIASMRPRAPPSSSSDVDASTCVGTSCASISITALCSSRSTGSSASGHASSTAVRVIGTGTRSTRRSGAGQSISGVATSRCSRASGASAASTRARSTGPLTTTTASFVP